MISHSLSIKDLTERADIGYATFFRHYKSKDELLAWISLGVISDIQNQMSIDVSPYENALALFSYIDENRPAFRVICSLPVDHEALRDTWDDARKFVASVYSARDEATIPLDLAIFHLMKSVWELVRWWVSDGEEYSIEQMAAFQSQIIVKVTEAVALEPMSSSVETAVD